jgi:hypothetical protein
MMLFPFGTSFPTGSVMGISVGGVAGGAFTLDDSVVEVLLAALVPAALEVSSPPQPVAAIATTNIARADKKALRIVPLL